MIPLVVVIDKFECIMNISCLILLVNLNHFRIKKTMSTLLQCLIRSDVGGSTSATTLAAIQDSLSSTPTSHVPSIMPTGGQEKQVNTFCHYGLHFLDHNGRNCVRLLPFF